MPHVDAMPASVRNYKIAKGEKRLHARGGDGLGVTNR